MMRPSYVTREALARASDIRQTANRNGSLDNAIQAASDQVDELMNRVFYPTKATRSFTWPDPNRSRSWRLWLDENDLVSLTEIRLRNTQTVVDPAAILLEPVNSGPPYNRIEVDVNSGASTATFGGSSGTQQAVQITGTWGYDNKVEYTGTLAQSVSGSIGSTGFRITDSSAAGVGDLLLIDTERLLVSDRSQVQTTATLAQSLSASNSANELQLTSSDVFANEMITVGVEQMLVLGVTGTTALVQRAQEGSVLAQHSPGDTVYAPRMLKVQRGQLGTTAAGHTQGVAFARQVYPALIIQLALAEAMTTLAQQNTAYARVAGAGENAVEASGKGLADLRLQAQNAYRRSMRLQAV